MNYYEQSERRNKWWGIIFLMFYLGACVGVMFLTYTIAVPEPEDVLVIEFGTIDSGKNDKDLALGKTETATANSSQTAVTEPVMTTTQEAPEVAPPPAREVNRRALFPGSSNANSADASAQNSSQGSPSGNVSAGGSGVDGNFDLAGRYGVIPMPLPTHPGKNLSGRVVVRINVDAEGKVVSATYEPVGSTTQESELVRAALAAARRTRFTAAEAEIQTGTITYIFKLN